MAVEHSMTLEELETFENDCRTARIEIEMALRRLAVVDEGETPQFLGMLRVATAIKTKFPADRPFPTLIIPGQPNPKFDFEAFFQDALPKKTDDVHKEIQTLADELISLSDHLKDSEPWPRPSYLIGDILSFLERVCKETMSVGFELREKQT